MRTIKTSRRTTIAKMKIMIDSISIIHLLAVFMIGRVSNLMPAYVAQLMADCLALGLFAQAGVDHDAVAAILIVDHEGPDGGRHVHGRDVDVIQRHECAVGQSSSRSFRMASTMPRTASRSRSDIFRLRSNRRPSFGLCWRDSLIS